MSKVFHIGCLHLGHDKTAVWRNFTDAEKYFEELKFQWNRTVSKRDKVFVHGDVTTEKSEYYYLLDELLGSKVVLLGNHDKPEHIQELLKHVDKVAGVIKYKNFWLTHMPVHPSELLRVRGNIHAHVHEKSIEKSTIIHQETEITSDNNFGYFDVSAKKLNYQPISFESIELLHSAPIPHTKQHENKK